MRTSKTIISFKIFLFLVMNVFYVSAQRMQQSVSLHAPDGLMCDLIAYTDYQSVNGYPVRPEWNVEGFEQYQAVRIHSKRPTFSWVLQDTSPNVLQTGYQILVSDHLDSLKAGIGNMWNSGMQLSARSSSVNYDGKVLQPRTVYYWTVRVWNNFGKESPYAVVVAFYTDSLLETHSTARYPLEKSYEYPISFRKVEDIFQADFGKDAFGQLKLQLFSETGTDTVIIHLGEALKADGRIDRKPGGTIRYSRYMLALREGLHTYRLKIRPDPINSRDVSIKMPDYIGEVTPFRYCELEGYTYPLGKDALVRTTVHYPFNENAAKFYSSDSLLNEVWKLGKYSMKATSFAGVFVDGDRERVPYEADAYINQLSYYAVDREYTLARYSHEYLIRHATWPTEWILQSVLMAGNDYLYTGDHRSVSYYYDDLKAKTLIGLQEANGLISSRTGRQTRQFLDAIHFAGNSLRDIVDWPHDKAPGTGEQIPGETDGFVFTDYNAVVNAYYFKALTVMAELADATGKCKEAIELRSQARDVRKQYQKSFWDKSRKVFRDGIGTNHASLHANMFALAFGLVKDKYKENVLSFIRSRGMACSVYGSQFLLDAVYDAGGGDYGLSLLTSRGDRSWYNMLRAGSTITMEAWDNKYKPNQDWNHAWGATPANIISRKLMGVEPLKPGWSEFRIRPQPGKLKQAKIKIPTIKGSIYVSVEQTEDTFFMEVIIPANTVAEVHMPALNTSRKVEMDNQVIKAVRKGDFFRIDRVGSGKHTFKINKESSR